MTDPFAPLGSSPSGGNPPKPPEWTSIAPVPPEAPAPPREHPELGRPSARWVYGDAHGELLGFVCRFDRTGRDKEFRPLVLFASPDGARLAWRWQSWDAPRPLYGLERLAKHPTAAVIVCEGEKAADAAGRLLPSFVAVTSPNGAKSAAKADWSPLAGRRVIIWPDADAAGGGYADAVAKLLSAAGAASVAKITPPEGVADKWDAADAEVEGWTEEDAAKLVDAALPLTAPKASAKSASGREEGAGAHRRRPRQSSSLIALTELCEFWHTPGKRAYVTMPVDGHRENWAVQSDDFKSWLSLRAFEESGEPPGSQAIEDTLRVLIARAVTYGPQRETWRRVGRDGDRYYLDLCDSRWRVVEISADGWRVLERHNAPFIRSQPMLELPEPEGGYSIDLLRRYVNTSTENDFILIVSWLVAALRSAGPYPILTINAEQGSGKSVLSRLLRKLCDPNDAPIRAAPSDLRVLQVMASNSHAIVLDNVSRIEPWLSDELCRISTGGGSAYRKQYSDDAEFVFKSMNPIILNGIPMLAERPDLAERAVMIRLRTISEEDRRPEDDFWSEWDIDGPRVLGALLDGVSAAAKNLSTTKLERSPRMADFAKWATAAEPGLGFDRGTFASAYSINRRESEDTSFEADAVAVAIHKMVTEDFPEGGWEGTASILLDAINFRTSEAVRKSRSWPQTAQALGNRLERVAPLLRARGLHVERRHSGIRNIRIVVVR